MPVELAVTCGDPAGVGPEVVASWLNAPDADHTGITAIGPMSWLATLPPTVGKIPVGLEGYRATPGQPDGEGALVALAAMEYAAAGCERGEFAGAVTAPVSKAQLARIGFAHPGQTEFFAAQWGGEPVMCFTGGRLRLALATWHVPLAEVPQVLGPQMLHRTVRAAHELARGEGVAEPRIAVCGLNPHAGEDGIMGEEERDFLNPALAKMQHEFPGLCPRCEPGDTLFARQLRGEFDVIVALYHDQGLAPLKTVDFDTAVNVTMGLPFVRTSPDHGTGFGIAGQGRADWRSLANAVTVARRLVAARAG